MFCGVHVPIGTPSLNLSFFLNQIFSLLLCLFFIFLIVWSFVNLFNDAFNTIQGVQYNSMVECLLMVQWVIGLIPLVKPLSYFSFQPVLHNWCNKGWGMYYPLCGMVCIKEFLLLNRKSSCGSRFPLSLSEWFFTICPTPYNHIPASAPQLV